MTHPDLVDKVAIVTGAGAGIGVPGCGNAGAVLLGQSRDRGQRLAR